MPTKVLGPWQGGLNLVANRDLSVTMSPNELGEATNITYTSQGFLQPRPGCKMFVDTTFGDDNLYYLIGENEATFHLVGWVDAGDLGMYSFISVRDGVNDTLYRVHESGDVAFMVSMTSGAHFTHLQRHSGFISDINIKNDEDATVDYWYPADTGCFFFTDTDNVMFYTTNPDFGNFTQFSDKMFVPGSHSGMIVKDRLFLFNETRCKMYYSPPQYIFDFRVFNELKPLPPPSTEFEPISVQAPYGKDTSGEEPIEPTNDPEDTIRCVEFKNNNFYIFKRNSTFMFTYQNSPITDGYMRKISDRMGAFDSTIYKENIIIVNNKGVFRVEGADFLDLQEKMNFRFEIPIDHTGVNKEDIFITNFNDTILFGMVDRVSPESVELEAPLTYYYALNGVTGAWSKWDYSYIPNCAAPGSDYTLCQSANTVKMKMLFTTFDRRKIVYMDWKPAYDLHNYHFDTDTNNDEQWSQLFLPPVNIKTAASFGDSLLHYKKLYRYFIRFYLSEDPIGPNEYPVWSLSLNYNEYKFDPKNNPKFHLYPMSPAPTGEDFERASAMSIESVVYKRIYQIALPQQRAKEFVFELTRRATVFPADTDLRNPDADRSIKAGYYFLLSGFWFDYDNKAGI